MDLTSAWKEKYETGKIRFDQNIELVHSSSGWGSVYYSEAREKYKAEVSDRPRATTFDLDLMAPLQIGMHGGLNIAANPNSLFEGHLVIYPQTKLRELTPTNISDVARLARVHPDHTFIHNADRSAASIVDWAHFQAYRSRFPIEGESHEQIAASDNLIISRIAKDFPAYALRVESENVENASALLAELARVLRSADNPQKQRIPVNYIWRGQTAWVVPRAKGQSEVAARYFGGLEIGGIFCVPNADLLGFYSPTNLREEMIASTLWSEDETRNWFEEQVVMVCGSR